jgi:hypothetical protein
MSKDKHVSPDVLRRVIASLWTTEQVQYALGCVTQPVVFLARKNYGLPFVPLPGNSHHVLFIPAEVEKWAKDNNYPFQKVTEAGVAKYRAAARVNRGGRTVFQSVNKKRGVLIKRPGRNQVSASA